MYSLSFTSKFKKDLKRIKSRSKKDFESLEIFIESLIKVGFDGIPKNHKPHYLIGNYRDHCECHVLNDLMLIWLQNDIEMTIILVRTGTHSDLF